MKLIFLPSILLPSLPFPPPLTTFSSLAYASFYDLVLVTIIVITHTALSKKIHKRK